MGSLVSVSDMVERADGDGVSGTSYNRQSEILLDILHLVSSAECFSNKNMHFHASVASLPTRGLCTTILSLFFKY